MENWLDEYTGGGPGIPAVRPDATRVKSRVPRLPNRTIGAQPQGPRRVMPNRLFDAAHAADEAVRAIGHQAKEHPISTALDMLPGVGDAKQLVESGAELLKGNVGAGLAGMALAAAPIAVPKGAKRGAKAAAEAERKAVRFFDHYSPHENLSELDAGFMGTGLPGAERQRINRPKMSHVYREGQRPEVQFARMPKYRVKVEGDIYDIAKDPQGIVKRLRDTRGLRGTELADAMEKELEKKGFAGYESSDDWNNPYGIAKLFGKHPMRRAGAVPKPDEPFAILTAANPGGVQRASRENAEGMTQLRKKLEERGYDVEDTKPTSGYLDEHTKQWVKEPGFLVRGIPPEEAMALGREFGQNSVVTNQGLHDLVDNKLVPAKGFIDGGNEFARTDLDGGSFALDLDWDNPQPIGGATKESLKSAAVRYPDGRIGYGPTHYHALGEKGYDEFSPGELEKIEEGFLTSSGRFVDRAEAERIAVPEPQQEDLDWLPEGQEYYQGSIHTADIAPLSDQVGELPAPAAPSWTLSERIPEYPGRELSDRVSRPQTVPKGAKRGAKVIEDAVTPWTAAAKRAGLLDEVTKFMPFSQASAFKLREAGAPRELVSRFNDFFEDPANYEKVIDGPAVDETIAKAAIKMPDGRILTGRSHLDALLSEGDGHLAMSTPEGAVDGWLTESGRFLTREEADGLDSVDFNPNKPPTVRVAAEHPAAPAVLTPERWRPTPRGVFDRSAGPRLQGTAEIPPELVPAPAGGRAKASPFVEAVANSKTVRKGLMADAEKGLPLGGDIWYEHGPIKADLDARTGAMSFPEFVRLGAVSSSQNPTTRELSTMSVLNYALRNDVPLEDAIKALNTMTRGKAPKPWVNDTYLDMAKRAEERGGVFPQSPLSEARKLPWYAHGKAGGAPNAEVALDTHERRRMMQLAMENPRLRRLARETGALGQAEANSGRVPIRNAIDYGLLSSIYQDAAKQLGLPSAQAFQAGRWIGGGEHTGLVSQPTGDFMQTVEDGLLYTARTRGLDETPAGLRSLWGRIAEGKDFFMPFYGSGGFPVY